MIEISVLRICGAKTRKGTACERSPCSNGRCSNHGGKSLAWFASPRFKHGRYSKYSFEAIRAQAEQRDRVILNMLSREMAKFDYDLTWQMWRALYRQCVATYEDRKRKRLARRAERQREPVEGRTALYSVT